MAEGLFIIELLNEIESVLADEPVAVAAMPPLGQVDFVEGAPVEAGGKHGLDFGDGVEPFEDGVGRFAVVEAAIDLLTDVVREAGDFSGAHGLGIGSKVGSLQTGWVASLRGCRLMGVSGCEYIIPDGQNHGGTESFGGDGVSGYQVIRIEIHEARRMLSPWCPLLPSWEGGLGHCSMPDQSVDQVIGLSSSRFRAFQAAVKGEISQGAPTLEQIPIRGLGPGRRFRPDEAVNIG